MRLCKTLRVLSVRENKNLGLLEGAVDFAAS